MTQDEQERADTLPGADEEEPRAPARQETAEGPTAEPPTDPLVGLSDDQRGLPQAVVAATDSLPGTPAEGAGRQPKREWRPGEQQPRQMKVGRVVSDKMDKTVIVAVEYTRQHPVYKKAMKRTSKFAAHDERNQCHIGDVVRIEETRPLSKTKRWVVREILQRQVVV